MNRIKQCKNTQELVRRSALTAIVFRELEQSRKKASEVEETAHPQQGFAF